MKKTPLFYLYLAVTRTKDKEKCQLATAIAR